MKKALLFAGSVVLLSTASLHAQGGLNGTGVCGNSPENPTLVLALVGSAGAFVASVRTRLKARRKSNQ